MNVSSSRPFRPITGRLAALAALAFCALNASRASALPPAEFYGLSGSDWTTESGWDEMAKTGAKTVRMQINWPGIQSNTLCTPGAPPTPVYNWSDTDAKVKWAAERGVRFLPVVYGNACSANHEFPDVGSPEYPQWLNFVDALVRRYGYNGSFWSSNPGLTTSSCEPLRAVRGLPRPPESLRHA